MTDDCQAIPCPVPRVGDQAKLTFKYSRLKGAPTDFEVIPPATAIASADRTDVRGVR